jgi:hypothetical protein
VGANDAPTKELYTAARIMLVAVDPELVSRLVGKIGALRLLPFASVAMACARIAATRPAAILVGSRPDEADQGVLVELASATGTDIIYVDELPDEAALFARMHDAIAAARRRRDGGSSPGTSL